MILSEGTKFSISEAWKDKTETQNDVRCVCSSSDMHVVFVWSAVVYINDCVMVSVVMFDANHLNLSQSLSSPATKR